MKNERTEVDEIIDLMRFDLAEEYNIDTTGKEEFYEGWHRATRYWLELLIESQIKDNK